MGTMVCRCGTSRIAKRKRQGVSLHERDNADVVSQGTRHVVPVGGFVLVEHLSIFG